LRLGRAGLSCGRAYSEIGIDLSARPATGLEIGQRTDISAAQIQASVDDKATLLTSSASHLAFPGRLWGPNATQRAGHKHKKATNAGEFSTAKKNWHQLRPSQGEDLMQPGG